MIGALIQVIIVLIIVGVIWWAIEQILPLIPLPEPFHRIIRILLHRLIGALMVGGALLLMAVGLYLIAPLVAPLHF